MRIGKYDQEFIAIFIRILFGHEITKVKWSALISEVNWIIEHMVSIILG